MATPHYYYRPRGIGSTQAKIPAKAIYTSLNLRNIEAQYTRPKLIAAGPQPMIQPNNTVWPWPWMCPSGPPSEFWIGERIDRIPWWPLHSKGTLKIALRLLAAAYYNYTASSRRPFNLFEERLQIPLQIEVDLQQYTNSGGTSPLVGNTFTSPTISQTINGFVATNSYIGSTILQQIWHQMGTSDQNMDWTASTKLCQAGAEDSQIFQNVYLDIDYDLSTWGTFSVIRQNPLFITVRIKEIDPADISWPVIYNDAQNGVFRTPDAIRIFNTSSAYYDMGRI